MESTFQLDIITPSSLHTYEQTAYVRAPSIDGLVGIQARHAHAIIALDIGEIKVISQNGKSKYFATNGGFADIRPEGVQLLLETFELAQDLNKERVEASLERAKKRVKDKHQDLGRAQMAVKRAQNRLHIISKLS